MGLDHRPQSAERVARGLHGVRGVQDLLAELEQPEQLEREQMIWPLPDLPSDDQTGLRCRPATVGFAQHAAHDVWPATWSSGMP